MIPDNRNMVTAMGTRSQAPISSELGCIYEDARAGKITLSQAKQAARRCGVTVIARSMREFLERLAGMLG